MYRSGEWVEEGGGRWKYSHPVNCGGREKQAVYEACGLSIGGPWGSTALRCKAHLPHGDGLLAHRFAATQGGQTVLFIGAENAHPQWWDGVEGDGGNGCPKNSPRLLLSPPPLRFVFLPAGPRGEEASTPLDTTFFFLSGWDVVTA